MHIGGFAYCQPMLVKGAEFARGFRSDSFRTRSLSTQYSHDLPATSPNSWLSSVERFRETAIQQQGKWSSNEIGLPKQKALRASDVLAESISELDKIVLSHSKPDGKK